jgi:hypothetical protein
LDGIKSQWILSQTFWLFTSASVPTVFSAPVFACARLAFSWEGECFQRDCLQKKASLFARSLNSFLPVTLLLQQPTREAPVDASKEGSVPENSAL